MKHQQIWKQFEKVVEKVLDIQVVREAEILSHRQGSFPNAITLVLSVDLYIIK